MKNLNGITMYFDSFSKEMLHEARNLGESKNDEMIFNSYRIQDFDSVKCGYFCLDWLNSVSDYDSYSKWLLEYSPWDYEGNDQLVMKRLNLN